MAKKKKIKREKDRLNTYQKEQIQEIIHGDSAMERISYLDSEDYFDPERLSQIFIVRVKNGESAEQLALYTYEVLKAICQHLQVPGRSNWTTKMEMAKGIRKFVKGKDTTKPKKSTVKAKATLKKSKESAKWMK